MKHYQLTRTFFNHEREWLRDNLGPGLYINEAWGFDKNYPWVATMTFNYKGLSEIEIYIMGEEECVLFEMRFGEIIA